MADTNPLRPTVYDNGKLLFFPPNRRHQVELVETTHCLIVRVGPSMLSRPGIDAHGLSDPLALHGWEAVWLARRLYAELLKRSAEAQRNGTLAAEDASASRALAVEGIILQLLVSVTRTGRERKYHGEVPWLRKVREMIETDYLRDFRLTELAAVAGVHRVHLVREFRRRYGMTIGQRIRGLRFEHACGLLSQTDLPLRDIAATCRFTDHSHFSKQFKKISGLTPAEYRNFVGAMRLQRTLPRTQPV